MKFIGLFLVAAFCVAELCAEITKDKDVLVLTDQNLEEAVKKYDTIIVLFYVNWCPHCKRILPQYDKAATTLKETNSPMKMGKVLCTKEKEACKAYKVRNYPTLKVFNQGKETQYKGQRTAEGMVEYAKKKTGA